MQDYWTQPATYDPREFDTRFRPEMLDFWLPHFVKLADLAAAQRVLDIGCGTGGFARAITQRVQADVIGVDVAAHLLRYAAAQSPALPIGWVLGRADDLPLDDQSVDRVLLSLVLHQISNRPSAAGHPGGVSRVASWWQTAGANRGARGGLAGLGTLPLFSEGR